MGATDAGMDPQQLQPERSQLLSYTAAPALLDELLAACASLKFSIQFLNSPAFLRIGMASPAPSSSLSLWPGGACPDRK